MQESVRLSVPPGLCRDPRSLRLGEGWEFRGADIYPFGDRLALEVASAQPWFETLCAIELKRVATEDGGEAFHYPADTSAGGVRALRAYLKVVELGRMVAFNHHAERDGGKPKALTVVEVSRIAYHVQCRLLGVPEPRGRIGAGGERGFHGIPTFFRAKCFEARQGGTSTYADAGWHLAIHLGENCPYGMEFEEWQGEIVRLMKMILDRLTTKHRSGFVPESEASGPIWQWFADNMPRCAALVPKKRRAKFLEGVRQAYEDQRI